MRITRAWCIELNEVVTIDVARRAYLSLESPPSRYSGGRPLLRARR